jgi:hypothetical protein
MGTPDALSSLAVLASYVAIDREKLVSGILLLMLSIWIRTDNVLFVVLMLVWLVWKKRIPALHSIVLGLLSVAAVLWINYLSGNYGWKVLFQYSFVGGRYPAEITPHINIGQYARAVPPGCSLDSRHGCSAETNAALSFLLAPHRYCIT